MQCFPVPWLHGTCWPAAALPPDGSTASSGFSPAQHTAFLLVADPQYSPRFGGWTVCFLVLPFLYCWCVSGSTWMSPNWNAGSAPGLFSLLISLQTPARLLLATPAALSLAFLDPCCLSHPTLLRATPAPVARVHLS